MRKRRVEARSKNGGAADSSYRQMLLSHRQELLASLGVHCDTISKLGRACEEDQAQIYHEEFLNVSLNRLDYEKLRQVEEALDRLKAGDYGTCQRCEEPIAARRLEIVPWAKYCVRCQDKVASQSAPATEEAFALTGRW
jgi:DnaK suppressor protein